MNGAFTLLRFEDARSIVYLENLGSASVTRRGGDVAQYEETFTDLQMGACVFPAAAWNAFVSDVKGRTTAL